MIIDVQFEEAGAWIRVGTTPHQFKFIVRTGLLANSVKLTAIRFYPEPANLSAGAEVVYDFILKERGHNPWRVSELE